MRHSEHLTLLRRSFGQTLSARLSVPSQGRAVCPFRCGPIDAIPGLPSTPSTVENIPPNFQGPSSCRHPREPRIRQRSAVRVGDMHTAHGARSGIRKRRIHCMAPVLLGGNRLRPDPVSPPVGTRSEDASGTVRPGWLPLTGPQISAISKFQSGRRLTTVRGGSGL